MESIRDLLFPPGQIYNLFRLVSTTFPLLINILTFTTKGSLEIMLARNWPFKRNYGQPFYVVLWEGPEFDLSKWHFCFFLVLFVAHYNCDEDE